MTEQKAFFFVNIAEIIQKCKKLCKILEINTQMQRKRL
jgi:hypothetical protein